MNHEETYMGHRIRIVTTRVADGTWSSTAELLDMAGVIVKSTACPSEEEAHRAAISAAMEEVDRRVRTGIGKP
jgi:hypothetical protein